MSSVAQTVTASSRCWDAAAGRRGLVRLSTKWSVQCLRSEHRSLQMIVSKFEHVLLKSGVSEIEEIRCVALAMVMLLRLMQQRARVALASFQQRTMRCADEVNK